MPNAPLSPDPDSTTERRTTAVAQPDAEAARRKHARARVYRRGGYLMAGLIAITALLSVVYVVANRHDAAEAEKGLVFVIPKGASANVDVPTIDSAIAIPTEITFAKGEPALLSIRNEDTVANRAGPWVIGPGQTYTARFDEPGTYEYVCTVDASESVTITVEGDA